MLYSEIVKYLRYITYGYVFDVIEDVDTNDISIAEKIIFGFGNWHLFFCGMLLWTLPRSLWFGTKRIACLFYGHVWEEKRFIYVIPFGVREECARCRKRKNEIGVRF